MKSFAHSEGCNRNWHFPYDLYVFIMYILSIYYNIIYVCVCVCVCELLSHVRLFCDPLDYSPPGSSLSIEFFRQGYWRGLPFPSPGDLPDQGIKPRSPALQADSLQSELLGRPYIYM